MDKGTVIMLLKRFVRTIVPQIPAFLAFTASWSIAPYLVLAGALITTLDKWLRENSEGYATVSGKIGL